MLDITSKLFLDYEKTHGILPVDPVIYAELLYKYMQVHTCGISTLASITNHTVEQIDNYLSLLVIKELTLTNGINSGSIPLEEAFAIAKMSPMLRHEYSIKINEAR